MRFAESNEPMRSSGAPDDEAPTPLPSLGQLPPLEQDDFDIPIADRPSAFALDDAEESGSSVFERDAVEGPSVEELIDDLDAQGSALDDGEAGSAPFDDGIDEAPDDGALGDDDDGLANDASDLDESLLVNERADDGADGVDADNVDLDDPTEPLDGAGERDDEALDPIVLPPLPDLDR
jgi:hypothetical protein